MSYNFGKNNTGMYITPEECIRNIKLYEPIIKYKIQLKNEWRQKGFYKYIKNKKTHYLVTIQTLFEMILSKYESEKIKEIMIEKDDFQIIYNSETTKTSNYLVGYTDNDEYFVTNFNQLPGNIEYCYKNIVNVK